MDRISVASEPEDEDWLLEARDETESSWDEEEEDGSIVDEDDDFLMKYCVWLKVQTLLKTKLYS